MELPAEPADGADESADLLDTESAWRRRAIERSTQAARLRAAKRVQRFLTSAREIIEAKGTTEFTVQEVVDHSKQSLRSFYQYFDGKHELLLGLFEEEIATSVTRLRDQDAGGDPLDRLHRSVVVLYEDASPGGASIQPLFFEFAQRLMVDHPEEVSRAYAPIYEHLVSIVGDAAEAGLLRPGKPRRLATIVMQAATTTASRSVAEPSSRGSQPITAEEVWDFCLHALVPDEIVAARMAAAAAPPKRRRS